VSSIGSMVSLVAVLGFVIIVWESLVSQRCVMFNLFLPTSIEWYHPYPPADHRYMEIPVISN